MKFFFLAIKHEHKDQLWEYLQNYLHPSARIVMAWETSQTAHKETNGEHFHIACDMSDNTYEAFKKTIILKQFKLRGQARDGIGRQYGLISEKKLRDETKFLTYTIKNNNYTFRNIDLETLQQLYSQSYIKDEKVSEDQLVCDYLLDNRIEHQVQHINYENIERFILMHYMNKGKRLCKSRLKILAIEYMMNHLPNRYNHLEDILYYIKN